MTWNARYRWMVFVVASAVSFAAVAGPIGQASAPDTQIANDWWTIRYGEEGLTQLTHTPDLHQANALSSRGVLGDVDVRFQVNDGDWMTLFPARQPVETDGSLLRYTTYEPGMPFSLEQTFTLDGRVLDWDIELRNRRGFAVHIGDLAIRVPWRSPSGSEDAEVLFEQSFTKRHFIAGDGSFFLFAKPGGAPPFLLLTVKPGTSLESFTSEGPGTYRAYIHSAYSGHEETRGSWRQSHTSTDLQPAGQEGDHVRYGFRLQWADSYDEVRDLLARERLLDVRVVPGMTVPEDLEARFAIRSAAPIDDVEAEFPDDTELEYLGEAAPNHHLYRVRFHRLGENMLTVRFDGGRTSYLEFFCTEPVETLLKKRSAFIVNRQQHRDPGRWYNGLFSIYDMKHQALRSPDDTDGYDYWWGYVLASDDPALGHAPYVASLNAIVPDPDEIAAVEYYLEHFVWGGLQRTDEDDPYPYGIYGVPNWKVARDEAARAQFENRRLDRMKIWRAYDYPHIVMLYYHMHQIADRYPDMVRYLDADEYLERMWQTARAFFVYPYEIYPWYDIYKWGFYNEMLIPEIIDLLEEKGRQEEADWLRAEWEKKVKYFVYDDPYPYRSEYPIDRTAYESSYALAKYGATHDMAPDERLWWDVNEERWHSHPEISRDAAREFMERQHLANLSMRGWLEPKYFLLGGDFTSSTDHHGLSYMSRMGGWSVLDYGLHFAEEPWDWLQLGYASYLASFALMNTGRPETTYGYWFPGAENDGALGWAFMDAKHGRAWIRKDEDRGAWRYDGEANLGMGAVVRTSATILAEDPLFGWIAYGGVLDDDTDGFRISPRDGVRIRFWLVDGTERLGVELARDGWSSERPITVNRDRSRIELPLENRVKTPHTTRLTLLGETTAAWTVSLDGEVVKPQVRAGKQTFDLTVSAAVHQLVLEKK